MNKLKEKFLFSFYIFVILAVFFGFFYFVKSISNPNNEKGIKTLADTEKVYIKIMPGMGLKEIAQALYGQKIIRSKFLFEAQSVVSGNFKKFLPGVYEIEKKSNPTWVIKILTSGPPEVKAIISPGTTLKEADEALSSLGITEANELVNFDINKIKEKHPLFKNAKSLEGLIFPDTYDFYLQEGAESVVDKILANFESKVYPQLENLQYSEKDDNLNWLSTASLLEKEVVDFNDQKIVAGILAKRLSKEMPLQIDATVIYAKCNGKFENCPKLIASDFLINSPYNTYKYKGLPPTPICNPELQAIIAALNPQSSEYWFYLSDPKTKKTIFSRTFEEHNFNRAKYLGI